MWQPYLDRNKNSGVTAFELGPDWIWVEFKGGNRYLYTVASAGASNVAAMHELAIDGKGLAGFISRLVGDNYADKIVPEEDCAVDDGNPENAI